VFHTLFLWTWRAFKINNFW